jgi:hypothetical protein
MALLTAGCSGGGHSGRPTTTAVPDQVTADRWAPPAITGGPSEANFCLALTAIYRHLADLPRVVSKPVTEDYLSDYVRFSPVVVAAAPPPVHPSAAIYVGAIATYLEQFVRAGLDLNHLPPASLSRLASPAVNSAYANMSRYAETQCHYTIGGAPNA